MGKWFGESTAYMLDHFGIPEDDWRNDKSIRTTGLLSHRNSMLMKTGGQIGTV